PDWQGSGHNSHVLALVNIARAQSAELPVASTLLAATEVKSKIEQDTRKPGRRYMRRRCSIRRCYQTQWWSVGTRSPAGEARPQHLELMRSSHQRGARSRAPQRTHYTTRLTNSRTLLLGQTRGIW